MAEIAKRQILGAGVGGWGGEGWGGVRGGGGGRAEGVGWGVGRGGGVGRAAGAGWVRASRALTNKPGKQSRDWKAEPENLTGSTGCRRSRTQYYITI